LRILATLQTGSLILIHGRLQFGNDRWQVTSERVGKLMDGPRMGQDAGVAAALK